MGIQIQLRRGNAAEWSASNPILASGEIGVELDTRQFKIGDGNLAWNALSYGGVVGQAGPPGPPGPAGIGGLNVLTPLAYDPLTQTLSLDEPLAGVIITGGNF